MTLGEQFGVPGLAVSWWPRFSRLRWEQLCPLFSRSCRVQLFSVKVSRPRWTRFASVSAVAAASGEMAVAAVSEQVARSLAAAVAAVVAVGLVADAAVAVSLAAVVMAVAVSVAADSVVPSLLEPWSSQFRGPMSWPRDSCLVRMLVCRPSPTRRLPLRIPEPSEVLLGWSLVDSAILCHLVEAESVFGVEPSQWARLEPPKELRCKAKQQSVLSEREKQV